VRNAQSTLTVDVQPEAPDSGRVGLRLAGELDVTSSPLLQAVIDQVLAPGRERCTHLMIDMSGVSFADASGLSPILMARAVLARRGAQVELRHSRRSVIRLLRQLGLEDLYADPG
jgi:anti-anti-sigma factor